MRKMMLALCLALCLTLGMVPGLTQSAGAADNAAFTDCGDEETARAVEVLRGFGIVEGYEDGSFRPGQLLTRAEFCKLAVMALGRGGDTAAYAQKTMFTDVARGNWAAGYVNLCCAEGLVSGYGDGRFGPGDSVTYGQAATILLRMLGYGTEQTGQNWPSDVILFAARIGLDQGLTVQAGTALTRGMAAQLLCRLLELDDSAGRQYAAAIEGVDAVKTVEGAVLVSAQNGTVTYRSQDGETTAEWKYTLSAAMAGERGLLLRNASGQTLGFLPDDHGWEDITVARVDDATILSTAGETYTVAAGALIMGQKTAYSYASTYVELLPGMTARLYLDESGQAACVYAAAFTEPQVTRQVAGTVALSVTEGKLTYVNQDANGEPLEATLADGAGQIITGETGTLLLSSQGKALGLLRDTGRSEDLTVRTVKASGVTGEDGLFRSLDSSVKLYLNGKLYSFNFWYDVPVGSQVRLYSDSTGAPWLLYVSGAAGSPWTMLETAAPLAEAASALSLPDDYTVVKNGVAATRDSLSRYDLVRYDSATNTLAVSDRRVSGLVQALGYADGRVSSVTMLGYAFPVLEAAAEQAASLSVGSQATLLLTGGSEAAYITTSRSISTQLLGILTLDGKGGASVQLDLGVTITGKAAAQQNTSLDGSLVLVSETESGVLLGVQPTAQTMGVLSLSAGTLGERTLAADCKVYDQAGKGRAVEVSLDDITWTSTLSASAVTWAHVNGAGQVDRILLNNVTGDALYYGVAAVSSKTETVSGGGWVHQNVTSVLTVDCGPGEQSPTGQGAKASGILNGAKVGAVIAGDGTLDSCIKLQSAQVTRSAFTADEAVNTGAYQLTVADGAMAYDESSESWMSVAEALSRFESFTVYYDRAPEAGGKVRLVTVA